jgi:hypothetical protein
MSKLKLGTIHSERPVRLSIELPAAVHRDLAVYAEVLSRETQQTLEPAALVAPMLARFIASDRAFVKARRAMRPAGRAPSVAPPKGGEPG